MVETTWRQDLVELLFDLQRTLIDDGQFSDELGDARQRVILFAERLATDSRFLFEFNLVAGERE